MNKQVDTNQPHVVELLEQINEYQNANANQDPDPDQKPKRKYNKKPKQSNTRAKASPITPATCIDPKKKQRVIIEQSDMRSEWMKENTSKDLPKVVEKGQHIIANTDYKPSYEIMSKMWPRFKQ